MVMTGWMIDVQGVTKSFGQTHALDDVSLVAGAGEVLGLLGPNGAGKTTLVRILATLLRPDRGTVRLAGVDVTRQPEIARRHLGLAGQSAAVDVVLTGRENLVLIGTLYGLDGDECRRRSEEMLDRFALTDAADRRVGTYSGGMRRRLDLGATLMGSPSVILLDEPTAGLDPRSRNELWQLVRGVAATGTTVLLTSQYLEEVERLADHIVVLDRGMVIADAPPDALKRAVVADVLEARVADDAQVDRAAAVFGGLGDADATVDLDDRRVAVTTSTGVASLVAAARGLDDAGIDLLDLSLRRPSLDDVFLALTDGTTHEPIHVPRTNASAALTTTDATAHGRSQPLRDMVAVTGRYLRRFTRSPNMFIFGAAQPVAFIVGLNAVFGGLVERFNGGEYIQYLLPGVIVMNILFTGGITSVGIAEDLQDGIADRFRSLPMSRTAVIVGRTMADLVRNVIAIVIVLLVGFALGFRVHGSVAAALGGLALAIAFSYATSWLFACLGMAVKSPQIAQMASFLPALPLVYLSGAWIPIDSMPGSLQAFARNQPVNVIVETLRAAANGTQSSTTFWPAIAWTAGILLVSIPLAVHLYRGDGA